MSDKAIDSKNTLSFQPPSEVDLEKRQFLIKATACTGAIGAAAVAVPFIGSMLPSERAKAAGAPVEVDISKVQPGTIMTVEWRGKPVWIINRTDEQTAQLAKHNDKLSDPMCDVTSQQPSYCKNSHRSIKDNISVVVGICTHLGCSPSEKMAKGGDMGDNWDGGFFCPCHGSKFDLAGRVYKGSPAPTNLVVPPHKYLTDSTLLIGVDDKAEA
jgi:ubiquinol-cytochrome c reductase iron-sulfur subunit